MKFAQPVIDFQSSFASIEHIWASSCVGGALHQVIWASTAGRGVHGIKPGTRPGQTWGQGSLQR